ncbi:DUF1223 domain-containing protein [Plastorhodobacter daqingensis]|uniref:DUF1223 domain-containing protein n=1 Tax=Plastorhodobacter daqingensis TaxID=1387281 RepID=A0ABW2UFB9_9RHOB
MRVIIGAALGLLLGTAGLVAEENPVVIELYTSQGCSACPPADALLERLADHRDVIALALHVDYWDYIGWADAFAQPGFTERQKGYARAVGDRAIYTPQMIVGGTDRIEGFRPIQLADLITAHRDRAQPVQLALTREAEDQVRIRLAPAPSAEPDAGKVALVQLVRYKPKETVTIARGENAGRTVTYHNIVTLWETIARWDGAAPLEMLARVEGDQPVVIIVQREGFGPVIGAARLP